MKPCRVCRKDFQATAHQIRKSDWICLTCRRANDAQWRVNRKQQGNPVQSTKMPRDWHRQYEKDYFADPENKKRAAANMRRYAKDPRLQQRHKARWITNKAIKTGELVKEPCVSCGAIKSEAHHPAYSKPLDVIWLCRSCHNKEHRNAKAEGRD
jgi:hypothetical protein